MKRDLNKAQEFLSVEQVSLPSACPTRWWSTTKLCKRYLKIQLAVCKMLVEYHPSKKHLMLEVHEVAAIEEFVKVTELLEEMTTTLGGSNYLTASSVLPLYSTIKKHLTHTDKDTELTKSIKTEILKPLKQRYDPEVPMASHLGISTLCDPRFRLKFLEKPDYIREITIKKMSEISRSSATLSTQSAPVQKKEKKGLAKFLDFDDENEIYESDDSNINIDEKKAEKEMTKYLSMPKVDCDECPLLWWKTYGTSFPLLSVLAKKHLATPGTSVPSERVFSSGGSVITKQRASLKPKNAEMQVFLAQNKNFI